MRPDIEAGPMDLKRNESRAAARLGSRCLFGQADERLAGERKGEHRAQS
jgi:hypothetical protein